LHAFFEGNNLKKKISSATSGFLVGGMVLFILGLLMVLRENPVFSLLSQFTSDVQVIDVFGVFSLFIGQALVVFGAMRSTANNMMSNIQAERRITLEGFNQSVQQFQNKLLYEQQTLKTGYTQAMAKIDALIANPPKAVAFKLQVLRRTNQGKQFLSRMRQS
jgi:hypothetical protein